jgi:uncharacterized protein YidB (DUF937 family)
MGAWDLVKKLYKRAGTAAESTAATGGAAAKSAAAATSAATKAAGSALSPAVAAARETAVAKLLGKTGDRLSGLLDKLRNADLDDVVKSWIAKGKNKPVTPEQVTAALGQKEVNSVATELGVSSEEAAGAIAKILPTIIDKLTPDGLVPDPEALAKRITGVFKK